MKPRIILLGLAFLLPLGAAAETSRSLKIKVLDAADGAPVAGAEVAYMLGRDATKVTTAADGAVEFKLPTDLPYADQMLNFNVTVRARGYGRRQVGWFASAGRVLDTLPGECEVRLVRGVAAGGVVRDAQDRPVAGATITLYGSGRSGGRLGGDNRRQQEYPEIMLYGKEAPVTDEAGRWSVADFPADLGEVTLTVTRPGGAQAFFMAGSAPDLAWQRGQRTDLGVLKSGQAVLNLKEGFTVSGRVVDESGRPLAGVTLRARNADSRSQPHEFTTGLDGRFELRNWDAAKVLVSAEREGFRGTTVTVPTGADAAPATLVLGAGQPFRLRVVDGNDAPIAGAEIMTDPNPGAQMLSWKATTDAEGRVVWNAAPDAPVKYWINAKAHGHRTAQFMADGSEHVVRFRPGEEKAIRVRLKVTDAATGAPLPNAEIWRRMPGGPGATPWGEADQTGQFAKEITKDEFTKGIVEAYRLEVRVAGYGSWGSDTLEFANGDQEVVVKLVKGGESRVPPPRRQTGNEQNGDTNPALLQMATRVARLLESGDVPTFVEAVCATPADWQAVMPPGSDPSTAPNNRDNGRALERQKKLVTASAERLIAQARQAGVEPGTVRFDVKSVTAPASGRSIYKIDGREVSAPLVPNIRITLTGEPAAGAAARLRGDYQIAVGQSHQLPAGWKSEQGVRWVAMPAGLGDEALKAELRLVNLATGETMGEARSLSVADDPALQALGEAVAGLLRTGDVASFVAAVGPAGLGLKGKELEKYETQLGDSARTLLAMPDRIRVDFARAPVTVQKVVAARVGGAAFGTVDGLGARPLQVVLNVGSDARGAGRYTLEFDQAVRRNGQWLLASGKMRWQEMPEGLLAGEDKETMALENYVAEHRSLPAGHRAPEIEFVRMTDESRVPLSSYRGKFVILEFWATWCGPCQEPMAKLQQLYQEHPEWKDRVEMVTVSIDSKAAKAAEHLQAKGWTKTTNFWAGAGEFKSAPATAYRVSGIPTSYVIGPDGRIVGAGHPESMDFVTLIETATRR